MKEGLCLLNKRRRTSLLYYQNVFLFGPMHTDKSADLRALLITSADGSLSGRQLKLLVWVGNSVLRKYRRLGGACRNRHVKEWSQFLGSAGGQMTEYLSRRLRFAADRFEHNLI